MPIFRKPRRQQSADEAPEVVTAPPRERPSGLGERLREIATSGCPPEEALEPALRVILEATGSRAGALCLFDSRHGLLRLAAEVGLSEQGCRRLRSVRRGDPAAWDMPLHGLLNRRAYLIESAARNRYVPRLVEGGGAVRTIACIPLYVHRVPLASLILVAVAPRAFVERDLLALERPLGELTRLIETVRRQGAAATETTPRPAPRPDPRVELGKVLAESEQLRAELTVRLAERERLRQEISTSITEQERLRAALAAAEQAETRRTAELVRFRGEAGRAESLATALVTAEQERARLAAALERAAAERAALAEAQVASETARAAADRATTSLRVDFEALRHSTAARTTEAAVEAVKLGTEIERLKNRLADTEAATTVERDIGRERELELARVVHELEGALARETHLRSALEAATASDAAGPDLERLQEQARIAATERAAAAAEVETAQRELASAQAVIEALEEEAAHAHGELERLEVAERLALVEQERLESSLAAAAVRATDAADRAANLELQLGTLGAERETLAKAAREADARAETVVAKLETIAAERDRLREALANASTERDRHASELEARTAAEARLREALASEVAERTRLTAELRRIEEAAAERQAAASAQTAVAERLAAERDRLAEELATALSDLGPAQTDQPVQVVTVAPATSSRSASRDTASTDPLIAVVDDDPAWASAGPQGHGVEVMAPGEELVARLAELEPARIVLNLAAPGGLASLRAIRDGGSTARVWGCLAAPGAGEALALGMIEPAARPLEPDAILTALGEFAGRGTRVVTAGADVDALMSLRQAFARRGMSVSMAWDAKQATDLIGVVRPEIAVIDLELPRGDGYAIVGILAAVDPPPVLVLVAGTEDPATAFAAALSDPRLTRPVAHDKLLAQLVHRSEAMPAERRQKLRSLGRGK